MRGRLRGSPRRECRCERGRNPPWRACSPRPGRSRQRRGTKSAGERREVRGAGCACSSRAARVQVVARSGAVLPSWVAKAASVVARIRFRASSRGRLCPVGCELASLPHRGLLCWPSSLPSRGGCSPSKPLSRDARTHSRGGCSPSKPLSRDVSRPHCSLRDASRQDAETSRDASLRFSIACLATTGSSAKSCGRAKPTTSHRHR